MRKLNLAGLIFIQFSIMSMFLISIGSEIASAVEVFSKDESPFGIPYDKWLSNWWTWWITLNQSAAAPIPGGCLIYESGSMVVLMDGALGGKHNQECTISSTQGVMIPVWTGFCDAGSEGQDKTYEELIKCAREELNIGAVTSLVKVDGSEIARLDEDSKVIGGELDYKINSIDNVTEVYSKGFDMTIPSRSHLPDQVPGTWHAGAHGWLVFLKPLPPGDHTVYYNAGVGTGPNKQSSEFTYLLHVK